MGDIAHPTHGSERPIPGMGLPIPGMGRPPKVVVNNKITTTKTQKPIPGMGVPAPSEGVEDPPMGQTVGPSHGSSAYVTQVADLIVAAQLGGQLGDKARQVLRYLNGIRSLEHDSYTIPVGYGQISSAASIDPDYLRRKVIPKLAMLGLIGIARRGLDGTVYHLPYNLEYIAAVTGSYSATPKRPIASQEEEESQISDPSFVWPDLCLRGSQIMGKHRTAITYALL